MAEQLIAVVGDMIRSRDHADRERLQRGLREVLAETNQRLEPLQPFEPTVGDEFQGGFAAIPEALAATLLIRLRLLELAEADTRYGVGDGAVTVFDGGSSPLSQDGPAWWAARGAVEKAERWAGHPRTAFARTCFSAWQGERELDSPQAAQIEAFLLGRDAIVAQMAPRGKRLLHGLLSGRSQAAMAAAEGITQSAVSQHLSRSGAYAVLAGQLRLEGSGEPWRS